MNDCISEPVPRGGPRQGEAESGVKIKSENNGSVEQESDMIRRGVGHRGTGGMELGLQTVSIGVCAMNKKTLAKPMQNILTRLSSYDYIDIQIFSDEVILHQPVDEWPVVDCLVAFYSDGFPLDKAIAYVDLRQPMVVNDLQEQYTLMDRQQVYETLVKNGVEVPKHVVLNRGGAEKELEIVENDDIIEVGGQVFHKPFVEKPVSAEDHNIYIYFPSDYGGGSQRLFRKVHNRSSAYSKESSVRKDGSYIYEEFLATDGTDVKVYVVGPDYAHAEARKSPALDGKVERDGQGKEVRYPVILNAKEKLIARKVCQAFKQTVCGLDLLRANGKSYVCDVNGFSFVKNSEKYYDDCAQILLEMVTAQLAPHLFPRTPPSVEYIVDEVPQLPIPIPRDSDGLELRCVVGVIRHGDRTPKQKMKMIVTHLRFIALFKELKGFEKGQIKIKKPKLLQRVLDISRYLLEDLHNSDDPSAQEIEEAEHKLLQLRTVLEMYGKFSGINRKVQLKHVNKNCPTEDPHLLLILKWGGELTPVGQRQAEELGRAFRCMYPGGEGEYASLPGSGFLRLHSTYRHDLKVYASDEGRVQMTAAAFTKGMLDLEGNLASVLVHLVKRDQAATNMLDTSTDTRAQEAMITVKKRLHSLMRSTSDFTSTSYTELVPTEAESIKSAMKIVRNPSVMNEQLHQNISILLEEIKQLQKDSNNDNSHVLYQNEGLHLMENRWAKLVKDFKSKSGWFDISKIPDIYDCIKYDMLHNRSLHFKSAPDVTSCAMPLADIVIPQEYGITLADKVDIGKKLCTPLFRKIQADFHHTIVDEQADVLHRLDARLSKGVVSPNRHVRSRLYFTSESHIHSLVNMLRHGGLEKHLSDTSTLIKALKEINRSPEFNYLTQIIFMLFEDTSKDLQAEDRFRVDIHFSPGVKFRQEVFVDDSDTISPTSSYTNMPIKSCPDLPKYHTFVKRLPQSGHEFSRQFNKPSIEQLMMSKLAPHPQKSSLVVSKTKTCDDFTVEEDQFRRYSTGVLKPNSDPLSQLMKVPELMSPMQSLDESLCSSGPSLYISPILKRQSVPETVKPTSQYPVDKMCVGILKHNSEVTQTCTQHSKVPSGKMSHGILKPMDAEQQKKMSDNKEQLLAHSRKVSFPEKTDSNEKTPEPEILGDLSDSSVTPREQTPVSRDSSERSSISDNDRPMRKRTKPFLSDSSDLDPFDDISSADSSLQSSEVTHDDVHLASELYKFQTEVHRALEHVEKRRGSEFSESSRSSDNTISTPMSVDPSSRKTSLGVSTNSTCSTLEDAKQPRKSSVPFLSSRSDSNLALLRKVSFPLSSANHHPFQKISDDRRSPSAIHGSMERLEVLEGLEPLKKDSTNSLVSLDWDGDKAPGLVLATELASTIEPLTLVCSAPLHQINGFFTSLTSVHLNFDPIVPAVNESSTPKHRSRSTTPISIPGGHRPYRRSFSEKQIPSQVEEKNKSEHKSIAEDKKLTQVPSLDLITLVPDSGKESAHGSTSTVTKGFKSYKSV